MGLRISRHARAHIEKGRTTVRPPSPDEQAVVAAIAGHGPVQGIGLDVLITLEAVRQLAEQGNKAAKWLYDEERKRLGLQ